MTYSLLGRAHFRDAPGMILEKRCHFDGKMNITYLAKNHYHFSLTI